MSKRAPRNSVGLGPTVYQSTVRVLVFVERWHAARLAWFEASEADREARHAAYLAASGPLAEAWEAHQDIVDPPPADVLARMGRSS